MTLKHTYIRTKHQQTPHRDQLPSKTFKKQNRTSKITLSHTNAHEHTRAKQSKAKQSKKESKVGAKTNLLFDCFFFFYQSKWKKGSKKVEGKVM